jgi:hypothetical protein
MIFLAENIQHRSSNTTVTALPAYNQREIPMDCYITLARAVVKQAVLDACGANPAYMPIDEDGQTEAQDWLTSADGILFEDMAGLDPYQVRDWVRRGCPYSRREVSALRKQYTGTTRKGRKNVF